jgi:DNA-binding HxlR family transcriptional regulator
VDEQLLVALKALSEPSRLRMIGQLAARRTMTVEALARTLDLSAGTVVHHLKRLRSAGLVESTPRPPYVDYYLRLERLAEIGRSLDRIGREQRGLPPDRAAGREPLPRWADARTGRTIHAFIRDGRLTEIPAHRGRRLVILRYLAAADFELETDYPEKEVNARLALRHPDVASLRRHLVDEGFMSRARSIYRLRPAADWPPLSG